MRKTKIICTMGPATEREGVLEQLVLSGMNVARLNFSHGSHEEQRQRLNQLKAIREKHGIPVASLLDTKGPEIRLKDFADKAVTLEKGQTFTLCVGEELGDESHVAISYENLWQEMQVGGRILIDDGLVELVVRSIEGTNIICEVINPGTISNRKGVNVPGVHLNMPYLSEKDKKDILFAVEEDMDFVAASFVRTADDVKQIRELLHANGGDNINIIAKIENGEGVENIDAIIEAADGIMIARGDMGVEIPTEEVPVIQKLIIKKVYGKGKHVITATQMLDSMMKNPRPTRAEATDVANAIYDGTSAIMLSGETAAGQYPVEALQMMVRIAERTEQDIDYKKRFQQYDKMVDPDVTDAICHATCTTAYDLNASAIIAVTKSGRSAREIARYRPGCKVIGCTTEPKVSRQLNLAWGIHPIMLKEESNIFELFAHAVSKAKEKGHIKDLDTVVMTAGVPLGKSGTTNMIKVEKVNEE